MKHFINDRASLVTDAVEAEVALSGGALRRLDGFPAIKVVLRADWDRSKVAVVSGGGSGHEPAHAGFVGEGLLTAAVCGEIFASPTVDAVLAAILAVTGPAGCLLVVKNYTGDRLNFGLAAERARALGHAVETVIVGDDVALGDAPRPRGIAGTLFVHKVAGHLARAGASLPEVKAAAERVARSAASIGVALSSCTIPGQAASSRIGDAEMELGLGIHGEPGARIVPLESADRVAATMMGLLEQALGTPDPVPVALLVNDLGGVPPIELAIVARAAVEAAKANPVRLVFGPARAMTSLDMKGVSLSVLPLTDVELETALLSPVGPRAWPVGRAIHAAVPLALDPALRTIERAPSAHAARRAALARICDALLVREAELDALDAKVGDGDTGATLATAARAILAELDALPFAVASELCAALAERLSRVMGGSSGILLAIFAAATGARLAQLREPAPRDWAAAMAEGARRMQEYGGAKPGDRTMLDALVPAIAAFEVTGDLEAAARAAAEGAAITATMTRAGAGRSSYLREASLAGHPDPGAVAVAGVFGALVADPS